MTIRFSNCNLPPYPEEEIKAAEEMQWAAMAGECTTRKMTEEEREYYGKTAYPLYPTNAASTQRKN